MILLTFGRTFGLVLIMAVGAGPTSLVVDAGTPKTGSGSEPIGPQPDMAGWKAGKEWGVVVRADSSKVYHADSQGKSIAWWVDQPALGASWTVEVDITITKTFGKLNWHDDSGSAGLGLTTGSDSPTPLIEVELKPTSAKLFQMSISYRHQKGRPILVTGWLPATDIAFNLRLTRWPGVHCLHVSLTGDKGLRYDSDTPDINATDLDSLTVCGLLANSGQFEFCNPRIVSPTPALGHFQSMATAAVDDLLTHFWIGGPDTGYIVPTAHGYPGEDLGKLARGGLWERGMMLFALENLYRATGDTLLLRRINADWQRTKKIFTAAEMEAAGGPIHPACDDSGWDAWMYLVIHRATGDTYALERAKGLINKAFERWSDGELGGSMWYNNERKRKSLYQVGVVMSALRIYELTRDENFRKRAIEDCYEWMETHLLRPDGLYWADYDKDGPIGAERPNDIREGGSVTFLGGNMGMGVLHARLYRMTGDDKYRLRALRTADAILNHLNDGKGTYLDDRDAWANGTFAGEWAQEVLTLPGIKEAHRDQLRATAEAIYHKARTPDGYYGGCWNGPADGPASHWSMVGSRPQQIMTSASAVNIIVAAAWLETERFEQRN